MCHIRALPQSILLLQRDTIYSISQQIKKCFCLVMLFMLYISIFQNVRKLTLSQIHSRFSGTQVFSAQTSHYQYADQNFLTAVIAHKEGNDV